jgi:enterobacteria phage integrase
VTPTELAQVFEMVAAAIRSGHFPASSTPAVAPVAGPVAPTRTLSAWLDVHEQQIMGKGYKAQTIRNRCANLRHVRRLWGSIQLDHLRAHEVISKLRAEFLPDRTSTAQRVLAELRDALNEAIANDWASSNPAAHVKLPTHRVKRKRLSFEVWQQMRELARSSGQSWLEPLLLLALVTGQRRGDLVKMAFTDVVDGCLRVEQQKQAGKGYGARIAIPLALRLDAIGMTLSDVIEQCRRAGSPGDTLVRKAGGGPLEESSLSIRFAECIRTACGPAAYATDEWPSLHEVRSLSARMYHAQGVDVQTLLGHKHSEMTDLYRDDRGLSAREWKPVPVAASEIGPAPA